MACSSSSTSPASRMNGELLPRFPSALQAQDPLVASKRAAQDCAAEESVRRGLAELERYRPSRTQRKGTSGLTQGLPCAHRKAAYRHLLSDNVAGTKLLQK